LLGLFLFAPQGVQAGGVVEIIGGEIRFPLFATADPPALPN
jgi:hypothetical protein